MKNQQTGLVLLGAFLIAMILAAVAYFFFISGELDRGATAREDAEFARGENELLELQIQQMQALEQSVPDWREQIARISLDLPPLIEQPDFERLLSDSLTEAGLPLVSSSYARATAVDPLALQEFSPPTLPGDDAEGGEGEPGADPSPTPSPEDGAEEPQTDPSAVPEAPAEEPVVEAPFTGLYGIPVTVTTEGDPAAILDFVKSMNTQLSRFFTVTNLSVQTASISEDEPGRPALTEEDWTVEITGLIFTLLDDERSFVIDSDEDLPEYEQGGGADNAFAPLPGTQTSSGS